MNNAWFQTYKETSFIPPLRDAWIDVNLSQLKENIRTLKSFAKSSRFCAVIKADGYGHGAIQVGRAAIEAGADFLAVSNLNEGLALRKAGLDVPILILNEIPQRAIKEAIDNELRLTIFSRAFAESVNDTLIEVGLEDYPVHLKLDTGMSRIGIVPSQVQQAAEDMANFSNIFVEGVFSHLACADDVDRSVTDRQVEIFLDGVDKLRKAGLQPKIIHICNSAGMLAFPEYHFDMVRPGISLFGYSPAEHLDNLGVKPVLEVKAVFKLIKRVDAGTKVSYGFTWESPTDTTLGTLPIGYADGIPRLLSNRGEVMVNGRRCPIVGRVCMDQVIVDLGADAEEQPGDIAYLISGVESFPNADELADLCETNNYEILTGLNSRLDRFYLSE